MARFRLMILLCMASIGVMLVVPNSSTAQVLATNTPPVASIPLATNTPNSSPSPLIIATNTPPVLVVPSATPLPTLTAIPEGFRPEAGFERYALRLWIEGDLVELLYAQVIALEAGDTEAIRATQLTNYELSRRFPGAPTDFGARQQLINAMLAAPRGSVDMRAMVRPFILGAVNINGVVEGVQTLVGFGVEIIPANLDGQGILDALVHVSYPPGAASQDAIYEDYLPLIASENSTFRLPEGIGQIPAAPFADIAAVNLQRFNNITGSGLDQFALTITRSGDVNHELLIFGWQADRISNLIAPESRILFGEIVDWPPDGRSLTTANYRLEESLWNCIDQLNVNWVYDRNFFRPVSNPDPNADYASQNTLACFARGFEPIFEQPISAMLSEFESFAAIFTPDEPGYERAQMVLAMLYVLDNREDAALAILNTLETLYPDDAWIMAETRAMREALAAADSSPVHVCAAVQFAVPYGACDLNQLLTRLFEAQPLSSESSVVDQLQSRGIPIIQTTMISAIGRADRLAVHIAGDVWWAFATLNSDFYTAEAIEAPTGYEIAVRSSLNPTLIDPPARAYELMTTQDDVTAGLLLLETTSNAAPTVPLSAEAYYFQALSYDLLGNRAAARQAYFDVWVTYPGTIWAALAAEHLELR